MSGPVYEVVLTDVDEKYAPPEKPVLVLARIGDDVMVSLRRADDDSCTKTSLTLIAEVFIPRSALRKALDLLDEEGG